MKKILTVLKISFFLIPFLASSNSFAQYYSGYNSWAAPVWGGYSLYGCLKGSYCTGGERAVTIVGLGVSGIEAGVNSYLDSKVTQNALQEMEYRAAEAQAAHNPQRIQDFQNIQNLNSFFLDTPVSPSTPTVQGKQPSKNGNGPQITPAPRSGDMRP